MKYRSNLTNYKVKYFVKTVHAKLQNTVFLPLFFYSYKFRKLQRIKSNVVSLLFSSRNMRPIRIGQMSSDQYLRSMSGTGIHMPTKRRGSYFETQFLIEIPLQIRQ